MSSGGDGGCSFGCFPFYFIAARLSRCLVACWRLKFYGILLCLKDLNVFVSDSLFCFPPGFRYSRQLFIESALGGYLFWKDVCISFLDFNTDIFLRLSFLPGSYWDETRTIYFLGKLSSYRDCEILGKNNVVQVEILSEKTIKKRWLWKGWRKMLL